MTPSALAWPSHLSLSWWHGRNTHLTRSRRVAIDLVGFLDILGVLVGGALAAAIMNPQSGVQLPAIAELQGWLLAAFFSYLCLRHFGLYDTEVVYDLPIRPLRIVSALAIAFSASFGMGKGLAMSPATVLSSYFLWGLAATGAIITGRLTARRWLRAAASAGSFDTRIAIYGTGVLADRLISVLSDPVLHCRFAGAYDDRTDAARHAPDTPGCLGGIDELIASGRAGQFDQVIIALPQSADRRTADIALRLEQLPVSLHVVTHLAGDLVEPVGSHRVSSFGPVGLLDIKTKPFADWGRHIKAVEDMVVGVIALIIALPVMALVAIAIKYDSPGPVIFRQRRHGLNKRPIEVLKFRSMSVMENGTDVKQAAKGDARITRVGAFLRKSSLDELPQLINVLRGDMSLIGPRPHALVHDDHYGEMLERYANRHQVKPGMTGWAQINGFRGPTDTPEKMRARVEHDLAYIDNWSLWLDLRILWLTVLRGFRHANAH